MSGPNLQIREESEILSILNFVWDENRKLGYVSGPHLAWHYLVRTISTIAASPFTSLLTLVTTTTALLIFGLFLLLYQNVGQAFQDTQEKVSLSIFLKDLSSIEETKALSQKIRSMSQVARVEVITPQQALVNLKKTLGEEQYVLDGLEQSNPLPASLEVTFKDEVSLQEIEKTILPDFRSSTAVDKVVFNRGLFEQLRSLANVFKALGVWAILVLLVITAFMIANTIKLALYSHRDEIDIMRLVGASRNFIRGPYLIEGVLQGLLGALFSLGLLWLIFRLGSSALSNSDFFHLFIGELTFLKATHCGLLLGCGSLIGLVGSYFAVAKFLKDG